MTSHVVSMHRISTRLGLGSALVAALTMLVFTGCFVGLVALQPLFTWTTLADYVTYAQTYYSLLPDLARVMMLCFGAAYIVLLNAIHDYAAVEQKILVRISLCFALFFAVLTGTHYFVQISAVRLSLMDGNLAGLEQVVQANPYSAFSAMNMLGWTLGLGLSSLFVAPVFSGGGLSSVIRVAFWLNGFFCLLGGVGYALEIIALVFLAMNIGMGGAVTVVSVALSLFFWRMK
jgi:hypothetical protein